MRHPVVDELEERRIARRLTSLAEAVAPLPEDEVEAIVSGVAAGVVVRRPARCFRIGSALPGLAAAAAALAIAVGIGHAERSSDDPGGRGSAPEQLLTFPEGSALELLLSRVDTERPA